MNYSSITFGKELYDLTLEDMTNFFLTEKEENLNLEFKSYPPQGDHKSKESAVIKAVCGLLNSEGGIVIWGAPVETRDANGNTSAIGDLTSFSSNLDRDRLINILSSSITPLPTGIKVQKITNQADEAVFIIEVQKSVGRPHQYDNRYYIRLDGQTRIAPHYLISALMKSVDFPVLRGHIRLKRIDITGNNFVLTFRKLLFNTSAYINDVNIHMQIIAHPGHIYVDNIIQGGRYSQKYPIISNGAPLMSNFTLVIPSHQINQSIDLIFQFGGEKSPSKISSYKYSLQPNPQLGDIADDSAFLREKSENKMPADTSNNTDDENIDLLLNT